jgi:hypothetical protein
MKDRIHALFSRARRCVASGIVIVLCAFVLLPGKNAQAQSTVVVARHATSSASVTILVLDMSGSMATNDPQGLRCSAANAYIDLSQPGNFIGIIGLDGGNGQGGAHNFDQAKIWSQPVETATVAQRQQLQQAIATNSHNCQPDSSTPTYDALNKSLQMLAMATHDGQIPGSIVLLTDGAPDPSTQEQINAIQTDLLPQFKEHDWPIDTIALGQDGPITGTNTTFHSFLSNVSNATSGKFYDDGKGDVPGVSPLNIAPFFVDIFARHNNRVATKDILPTALDGGTTRRNFSVADYTNSLDVVVVKDQHATTASLRTPNGQVVTQTGSGVFVSPHNPNQDYYEIFSIDHPQAGQWELDVTGSGQFLMDSLKVSGVGLSAINVTQANLTVAPNAALALGAPLTVTANVTVNGTPITDNRFTLSGKITYSGAANGYSQVFALNDASSPGTYTGVVTVPDTGQAGSYEILVQASLVSMDAVVARQDRIARIEAFPAPFFISPQTHQPTDATVTSEVVQWDPLLRVLYDLPLINRLGSWPLNGQLAQPSANIAGQVILHQQAYNDAKVSAVASSNGSGKSILVTIVNAGGGLFHIQFPASANGLYLVSFQTSGNFSDSHGDFGTTQRTIRLSIIPATVSQEIHAWLLTVLYLLALFFLIFLGRYIIWPHPSGEWIGSQGGDIVGRSNFARAKRNWLRAFFKPGLLYSREAKMPKGLRLHFRRGSIEVQKEGSAGKNWQSVNSSEFIYHPYEDEDGDEETEPITFLLKARVDKGNEEDEYTRSPAYTRQKDRDIDDEEDRPRRGRGRRGRSVDDNEEDQPRRQGRRGRLVDDYEEEDRPRSRRGRGKSIDDEEEDISPSWKRRANRSLDDDSGRSSR